MRQAKLFSQKVNQWEVLVTSMAARLDEFEWMRPLYEELLELVGQLRTLVVEQEAARADFHATIARRQEKEKQGVELHGRIAAHLKAYFGFRNELLRQFGLNPLPRITRNKPDEGPVTTELVAADESETEEDQA